MNKALLAAPAYWAAAHFLHLPDPEAGFIAAIGFFSGRFSLKRLAR